MPGQTEDALQVIQDCIGGQPVGLRRRTGECGRDVIPRGLLGLGRGVWLDRRRAGAPRAAAVRSSCGRRLNSSGQDCGVSGSVLTQEICSSPSAFIFAARRTDTVRSSPASGPLAVLMIVCRGGSTLNASGSHGRTSPALAATMTGRGTSLKAHQLVGAHLKAWQIDVEHLLCRRVAGQHADQSRGNRLVRRCRRGLHLEEHRAGSAGRDATGVAVQQLAEACGAKRDSEIGFGIVKFVGSGAVLPCRDLFEQPLAQDRCVERTAIEQDSIHAGRSLRKSARWCVTALSAA